MSLIYKLVHVWEVLTDYKYCRTRQLTRAQYGSSSNSHIGWCISIEVNFLCKGKKEISSYKKLRLDFVNIGGDKF